MTKEVPSRALEGTNLALGAALACAALLSAEIPIAAWNAGFVGTLIAFCALMALYRFGSWAEWSNVALGTWAVIAPFVLGFGAASSAMWLHVVVGACVTSIAIMQLMAVHARAT